MLRKGFKSHRVLGSFVAVLIGFSIWLGGCVKEAPQDLLYENEKFGFALTLPQDFAQKVEVKEEGNVVYFVSKGIQSTALDGIFGIVGRIEIYPKKEATRESLKEREEIYNLRYLGENDQYYLGSAHATDVQVPPGASEGVHEEFRALEARFDEVLQSLQISPQVKVK